jgi:hypothetical protein
MLVAAVCALLAAATKKAEKAFVVLHDHTGAQA